MRTRQQTERFLGYAVAAFAVLLVLQWLFGVREPGASEITRWTIGAAKVAVMLALVVLGVRWLQLKHSERNTKAGSN